MNDADPKWDAIALHTDEIVPLFAASCWECDVDPWSIPVGRYDRESHEYEGYGVKYIFNDTETVKQAVARWRKTRGSSATAENRYAAAETRLSRRR